MRNVILLIILLLVINAACVFCCDMSSNNTLNSVRNFLASHFMNVEDEWLSGKKINVLAIKINTYT